MAIINRHLFAQKKKCGRIFSSKLFSQMTRWSFSSHDDYYLNVNEHSKTEYTTVIDWILNNPETTHIERPGVPV